MTAITGVHPYADKFPMLPDSDKRLIGHSFDSMVIAEVSESIEFPGFFDIQVFIDGETRYLDLPCDPSIIQEVLDKLAPRISFRWLVRDRDRNHTPKSPPRITPKSSVYFISDEDGYVKIGVAKNVDSRLQSLQTASRQKLTLLGSVEGDYDDESSYHKMFTDQRVRGEWFAPSVKLEYFIKEMTK